MLDVIHGKANIKTAKKQAFTLVDYMRYYGNLKNEYGQSEERAQTIKKVIKHIEAFDGGVLLADVDKSFCLDFIKYLSSANHYYSVLVAVLNQAVREELIESNPTSKVNPEERKAITPNGCERTYLSLDELQRLIDAKCGNENVKNAFLFACYTGLRISDIKSLLWSEIKTENDQMFIQKQMTKTRQVVIVPIGKKALSYLPPKARTHVFTLPTEGTINETLKIWAKRAEIKKNLHFHVSRHTFATSLLTKGADLYSVSKLLGHTDIAITQVYAEIVNAKRVEAINLLDN